MEKEMKTQLTREKILSAGIEEFGRNGYRGGSINAICAAGISKGLIYHNFRDRDVLYLACVQRSLEDMVKSIETQMEDPAVSYSTARQRFFDTHEMEAHLFLETAVNPPQELRNEIEALWQPVEALNRREFDRLLDKHRLRDGVSRETAFQWMKCMQSVYNAFFRENISTEDSFASRMQKHEEGAAQFVDLLLYGIAVPEEVS